jgi:MFS transporter, SHS family, sialic acid transporter
MQMSLPAATASGRWLALIAALLGWMFDGLEMGLFPLIANNALKDLLGPTATKADIDQWFAIITSTFLIGAATGGVLFGWLGDRIGRVRAMSLSVLTYALFSGLCGIAAEAWQIAGLRFIASLGMGGEWSLGVALVMEVWPDRSRAWLAGVIGAAANFGYCIIALVSLGLNSIILDLQVFLTQIGLSSDQVDSLTRNSAWRMLMMFGAAPALLTFVIRLFVPESDKWEQEKERGVTSAWQTQDLLAVLGGAIVALGLVAVWATDLPRFVQLLVTPVLITMISIGYLYPISKFIHRVEPDQEKSKRRFLTRRLLLAAGLSGVALLGTWGSTQWAPKWTDQISNGAKGAKETIQIATSIGACIGCVAAALLGGSIGRRLTYRILCLGSMLSIWGLYGLNDSYNTQLIVFAFLAGTVSASFYGWLPLYLPELFPTRIRAIGQGFGFNFGRILAAIGVLQLPIIMKQWDLTFPQACSAMALIYLCGIVLISFAPETKGQPLPD